MAENVFKPLTQTEQETATTLVLAWFVNEGITLELNTEENPLGRDIIDLVMLKEPPKADVKAYWSGGLKPPREATYTVWLAVPDEYYKFTILYTDETTAQITSSEIVPKARPSYSCADDNVASALLLGGTLGEGEFAVEVPPNEEFVNALFARGITQADIDNGKIYLDVSIDGRLDNLNKCLDCEGETAILKESPRPHSFYLTPFWNDGYDAGTDAYNQPIEGVSAFVDRRTNTVLKVIDTGVITPIKKDYLKYDRADSTQLKPLVISQPEGPSYVLEDDGYTIKWGDWIITWGVRADTGLVLYRVRYNDRTHVDPNDVTKTTRDIIYRASLAELATLYGSPEFNTVMRNYLDIREYPPRDFMIPLTPGIQVPSHATLKNVNFTLYDGSIYPVEAVAIYEMDHGNIYSHQNYACLEGECPESPGLEGTCLVGSRGRALYITVVHTIGNYDYIVNHIFDMGGRYRAEIQATGVLENMGTHYENNPGDDVELYGNLTNHNVIGLNHTHIGCFRLDLDIDGENNRVLESSIVPAKVSEENPCGNSFVEEEKLLTTEKCAVRNDNCDKGVSWVVTNEESTNELGYPRGYHLIPFPMPKGLVNSRSRIGKRAIFTQNDLYVTKYREGELDAMGEFPVERGRDLGIKKYIKNNESIVDEDVVLWYSTGFGHPPSVEQYPVMNTEVFGFNLVPEMFFNSNPALYYEPIVTTAGAAGPAPKNVRKGTLHGKVGINKVNAIRKNGCASCQKNKK